MTGVEELQEIERFAAANLTENDAVRAVAEGRFERSRMRTAGRPFCGCRASKRTRFSWCI